MSKVLKQTKRGSSLSKAIFPLLLLLALIFSSAALSKAVYENEKLAERFEGGTKAYLFNLCIFNSVTFFKGGGCMQEAFARANVSDEIVLNRKAQTFLIDSNRKDRIKIAYSVFFAFTQKEFKLENLPASILVDFENFPQLLSAAYRVLKFKTPKEGSIANIPYNFLFGNGGVVYEDVIDGPLILTSTGHSPNFDPLDGEDKEIALRLAKEGRVLWVGGYDSSKKMKGAGCKGIAEYCFLMPYTFFFKSEEVESPLVLNGTYASSLSVFSLITLVWDRMPEETSPEDVFSMLVSCTEARLLNQDPDPVSGLGELDVDCFVSNARSS